MTGSGTEDDSARGDQAETLQRLADARVLAADFEADRALARLQSNLFGLRPDNPVLDRYPVIGPLGRGGGGIVYLAYDPRLDRKVAIKLLHASAGAGHATLDGGARLMREAQAMARSPHPNVVAVYDVGTFGTEEGRGPSLFVVMEYVEGPTLHAWLRHDHPWSEILDVFVAAGRGLAAAHAVGVTHRDFKPGNVIVGDDGRVRVLDFGLARGSGGQEDAISIEYGSPRTELDPLQALTAEGTVLGTPLYMPPEQHAGAAADAASDQYSWCVSLWFALYRQRPFEGRSLEELALAKRVSRPTVPEATDVPGWIEPLLRRGLAPEPSERWPSMEALLEAFTTGVERRQRRRRLLAAAAIIAPVLGGAWALGREDPKCKHTPTAEDVWDAQHREAVRAAFEDRASGHGAVAFERLDAEVDRFVRAWTDGARAACEATHVHHEQSSELLDLRMLCLTHQRERVEAFVELAGQTDDETLDRTIAAVGRLPSPAACEDVQGLMTALAPPASGAVADAVEHLRHDLVRAEALGSAGRLADASSLAEVVAVRAGKLDYPPVLAEALVVKGRLQERSADYEGALETLGEAHSIALAAGHDKIAAEAAQSILFVHGEHRAELDTALQWAQIARAELQRAGAGPDNADIAASVAAAYRVAGDFGTAKRHLLEALEVLQDEGSRDEVRIATLHNDLGDVLRELGEYGSARENVERALSILERLYGPDHAAVGAPVNLLGTVALAEHDYASAEVHFRRALRLRRASLGPDHPRVAMSLHNLGVALRHQDDLAGAETAFEEALAILERRPDPNDDHIGTLLMSLGNLAGMQGDHHRGRDYQERALVRFEAFAGPDHPTVAMALVNLAVEHTLLADWDAADRDLARALKIRTETFGAGHPMVAAARLAAARALAEVGRPERARTLAEQALAELDADADRRLQREIETFVDSLTTP